MSLNLTTERAKELTTTCRTDRSFLKEYLTSPYEINNSTGEEAIHRDIVMWLSELSSAGKLRCTWHHPPNQFDGQTNNIYGARLRRMGKIKGVPDLAFGWGTGSGFLEVKKPKTGRLSPFQELWSGWCFLEGVHYAVVYSLDDAKSALASWGLLPVD